MKKKIGFGLVLMLLTCYSFEGKTQGTLPTQTSTIDFSNYPDIEGLIFSNQASPLSDEELKYLYPQLNKKVAKNASQKGGITSDVKITNNHGTFAWVSNGNKPLIPLLKTMIVPPESMIRPPERIAYGITTGIPNTPLSGETKITFLVLINPNDEGFVIIPQFSTVKIFPEPCEDHYFRYCESGCKARSGFNVIEYIPNQNGTLDVRIGRTHPLFPYPRSDVCPDVGQGKNIKFVPLVPKSFQ